MVAVVLMPHAPCRVRVILTEGTLTRVDRATLRALLAHEIAHMQLSHPDARQARADAQKQTEKEVKTASSAASKAASFIPGVGGLVSKGISTARKGVTAAMEMGGNPYLPEEEQAADAMAATLLNEAEASSCRALTALLEERLRNPDEEAWEAWLHAHPVSAERIEALSAPCPDTACGFDRDDELGAPLAADSDGTSDCWTQRRAVELCPTGRLDVSLNAEDDLPAHKHTRGTGTAEDRKGFGFECLSRP